MKKFLLICSAITIFYSCSTREMEIDNSRVLNLTEKNANLKKNHLGINNDDEPMVITINNSPVAAVCQGYLGNNDIQIHISKPAPYDMMISVLLKQKYNSGYLGVGDPWGSIAYIHKGEQWVTLEASCELQMAYIQCGRYVEIKEGKFRLEITNVKYFNPEITSTPTPTPNYVFYDNKNYFEFSHYKNCDGGPRID
ncbi:hypothetical protein DSC47_01830 [Elizabethkingia miricola]|uniref:hypothetical protein n=1 Tax=Elizabethkingia bruuniana TaxID=1756149 RepID=UPI0009991829|nr:hypothetical protein [Elizabethkingia bruuniana]OPC53286.1 hypothetical protein BAY07_14550 [Elizabethkingia bruuniana]RBI93662.1 hypothetical protein DSC47_01830 [Elizabethkingia miricola]